MGFVAATRLTQHLAAQRGDSFEPAALLTVRTQMRRGAHRTGTGQRARAGDPARALAGIVILLGHAMLLCFISRQAPVQRDAEGDDFSTAPIYVMPIAGSRQETPPPPRRADNATALPVQQEGSGDDGEVLEAAATTAPASQPVNEGESARLDLLNAPAEVARLLEQSRHLGFAEPPEDDVLRQKEPPGVFERGPPHRAGDIEIFERGFERRWVSSSCYQEYGVPRDPLARTIPRVNPVHCLSGSRAVDMDLFDHLKPGYLKQKR
jgi:hypothetical protein